MGVPRPDLGELIGNRRLHSAMLRQFPDSNNYHDLCRIFDSAANGPGDFRNLTVPPAA
jgi:hypothetical protein